MLIKQKKPDGTFLEKKIDNVFIIIDIGSTHCADIEIAKKLIRYASISGIDCIKFQKRCTKALLTKEGRERKYDSPHAMGDTYGEHRDNMELSSDNFRELKEYTLERNMFFTASAWDEPSLDFLVSLDVPFIKVASADLTNLPFLKKISQKTQNVILSTGMSNQNDIDTAIEIFKNNNLGILQCTSSYPTPYEHVNLNVLKTFQEKYPNHIVGFSGHTEGYHIALGAVALGAKIIEKHFTLDKSLKGSDHKSALNPPELINFVKQCRELEKALGSSQKEIQNSEYSCISKLCKSVVSKTDIPDDTTITEDMITTKSPGLGIPAKDFYKIIGRKTSTFVEEDTLIYGYQIKK